MEHEYTVAANGKPVGKVTVLRQGLYYYFSCRCRLSGDVIYRLMVTSGKIRENLGVLVPLDGSFVLDRKLPVKQIGEGELSFFLKAKYDTDEGTFVPISPEEPFAYISRLKKSFLVLQHGEQGIYIPKMQES